jgi:hypothetical protein
VAGTPQLVDRFHTTKHSVGTETPKQEQKKTICRLQMSPEQQQIIKEEEEEKETKEHSHYTNKTLFVELT